ncbi:NifB/NifX family molybdenum-iron cluster-binding protein [Methanolobus sp. WCC4]|uniref:NifB/NifX family molybdenum-iron cluster-binding protein n=1 Tax=Methanolobus sp. WCC4 TaxID=3125784 RepID=UPI0030F66CBC
MKICVTSKDVGLDAPVDPHFGRCGYFVMVDPETMDQLSLKNEQVSASGGAGVQAAQQVISEGIDVLITGSLGPNAFSLLSAENIEVRVCSTGSVKEAVDAYGSNSLETIKEANSPGKPGM